ncbi:MAG TPA: hypothetical protein ENN19_18310 [Chloroflexi bacterium]|nr:hypothetical protein [Chloroflexota bacterium]
MRRNPERFAWFTLWTFFFLCLALSGAVPWSIHRYLLFTQIAQKSDLEVFKAPVNVTLPNRDLPNSVSDGMHDLPPNTTISATDASGQLVIHHPKENVVLATVRLYENTNVTFVSGRSPRFAASHLPHHVVVNLEIGRTRIDIFDQKDRVTVVEVNSPFGTSMLTAGTYEIKVNSATMETSVRQGLAHISQGEHSRSVALAPGERALVADEQIIGPRPAAHNLILNGDFLNPLGECWTAFSQNVEIPEQPRGHVQRSNVDNHPVLIIERAGMGHAETGVTQSIQADIRDMNFLQLHLLLRSKEYGIKEHNLRVCGSDGSECPVMVLIDYKDAQGVDREWLKGFYWRLDENISQNPSVCVMCTTHNEHIKVPRGNWYRYLSPNLIPAFSQEGHPPIRIRGITIYASGHTYHSMVAEAQIIGVERSSAITHELIANGTFTTPLGANWSSYNQNVERDDQPEGIVRLSKVDERTAVVIQRQGIGHAETGIRQPLNVESGDFESLQLQLLLRVEDHDLPMCGSDGSECPIMVRIDYQDASGAERDWLQGFFWQPNKTPNPTVCTTCTTRNEHGKVQEDTWYPYLSPNLIPLFSQNGQAPSSIESITIYASGHSYHSMITEVELIGQK